MSKMFVLTNILRVNAPISRLKVINDDLLLQMLQREQYILSEYNRLTGRHLEPLMKAFSPET